MSVACMGISCSRGLRASSDSAGHDGIVEFGSALFAFGSSWAITWCRFFNGSFFFWGTLVLGIGLFRRSVQVFSGDGIDEHEFPDVQHSKSMSAGDMRHGNESPLCCISLGESIEGLVSGVAYQGRHSKGGILEN